MPLTQYSQIDNEIDDATWMHVDEYKKQTKHEMMSKIINDLPLYNPKSQDDPSRKGALTGEFRESIMTSIIPGRGKLKFYSPF